MIEKLQPLIEKLNALHQEAYLAYKPEVEHLIATKTKDNKIIEHLLDEILSFCSDDQMLLLFKKLCRYYWDINPQATADYIITYREMWDNENDKNDEDVN